MKIETIRRISLARHLFELGSGCLRSKNDLHLFAAVNLAQDAIEAFLLALAEHIEIAFDQNTKFEKYFTLIDEKIRPRELPFKSKLLRLNRVRVNSKHHGIQPARIECERLITSAHEFMDEVSVTIFGAPFASICYIDLLDETQSKMHLTEAKAAIESKDYRDCLIHCRKAVYLEIESRYDISAFQNEGTTLYGLLSKAPYYAKNKAYISENVHEPTDHIVLDPAAIDQELLTQGGDPTAFWNILRLTPDVFRTNKDNWIVKEEFSKVEDALIGEVSEYVFATSVDLLLCLHSNRRAVKHRQEGRYYVDLAREDIPVYLSADRNSKITTRVNPGITQLDVDYKIAGLNDDGPYWHVVNFEGQHVYGFIHNDDVRV